MEDVRGNIRESVGSGSIKEAVKGNTRIHLCNQVNEIPIVRTMLLPNLPPYTPSSLSLRIAYAIVHAVSTSSDAFKWAHRVHTRSR